MKLIKKINRLKESKVTKNSIWIISEKIFQMIISLFVNRIVAEYLQPENYGTLNYVISLVTFFTSLCTLGLDAIIINEIINKKDKQGEILGTSIFMRLISSFISTVLIVIVVLFLKPNNNTILIMAILQSMCLFFHAFDSLNIWYQSKLKSKYTSIIAFITYIIVALYRVYIVVTEKSLEWFALYNVLSVFLTSMLTLGLYKKQKGPKLQINRSIIKPLLKKSYPFILSGLMIAIYGQTDKIMLGSFMPDMTGVGLYSVAITITNLWSFIPSAIITSFRPTIISAKLESNEKYIKRLKQLYSIILWVNIAYALFVTLFADIIINVLYGEAYIGAKIPLLLAVWSGGFSYIGVARDIWFVSEGYQKYSTWISLAGCLTNVILNYLMIPVLGIVGAALATTITQIMTGLISTLFFKKTRINTKYILESVIFKF